MGKNLGTEKHRLCLGPKATVVTMGLCLCHPHCGSSSAQGTALPKEVANVWRCPGSEWWDVAKGHKAPQREEDTRSILVGSARHEACLQMLAQVKLPGLDGKEVAPT